MGKKPVNRTIPQVSEMIRPETRALIDEAFKLISDNIARLQPDRLTPVYRYEVMHMLAARGLEALKREIGGKR